MIFIVLILSYFCDSFAASSHNTQKSLHLGFQDVKDITSISPLGTSPKGFPPSCFKRFYFLSRSAMKLLSWDFSINWHLPLRMRCFLNPMFSTLLLVCLLILVEHIIHSFLRKGQIHKNVWDSPCIKMSLLKHILLCEDLMFSLSIVKIKIKVLVAQWFPTLSNPDYSPPSSSVHEIHQARMLKLVPVSFSTGFSWPGDWIHVSCIAGGFFLSSEPLGKPNSKNIYLSVFAKCNSDTQSFVQSLLRCPCFLSVK